MFYSGKFQKKYLIKVPKTVSVIYCEKKQLIVFTGLLQAKSLKLKVMVFLVPTIHSILVTDIPMLSASTLEFKSAKKLQGTLVAKMKQMFVEISYILHSKLNLVGVSYKAFSYEGLENNIYLKLGYSHLIYFKMPSLFKIYCQKFTRLFVFGNSSFEFLKQIVSKIRAVKCPEPYKGKGILYSQEKLTLKKGKKI